MKPYAKKRGTHPVDMSHYPPNGKGGYKLGISKLGKLVTRNADMAMKKTMRQRANKEINN